MIIGSPIILGGSNASTVSAKIVITGALSTDTITCTYGGQTKTGTWESGNFVFNGLTDYGTYVVRGVRNGITRTKNVNVTTIGIYSITIDYPEIPEEYTQLEFIGSNGTQYIDTEITPTSNYNMKLTIMPYNASGGVYEGVYAGTDAAALWFGCYYTNAFAGTYNSGVFAIPWVQDTKHVLELNFLGDVELDDTVIGTASGSLPTSSHSMYLFATYDIATSSITYGYDKIYGCEIYNGSTLVAKYYPAKRISDNVLGLYESVSGSFKRNQGTGTFIAGDPV